MEKLTQKQLILEYVKEYGTITPATLNNRLFKGQWIGSQADRRCRELRADNKLLSRGEGKFEVFYLPNTEHPPLIREINKCCSGFPFFQIHNQDCITLKKQNLFS